MPIEELTKRLTEELQLDEGTVNLATDKTLAIVKAVGDDDLFSKISAAIEGPGPTGDAGSMASTYADPRGGGVLDRISGIAAEEIGGSQGRAAGLGSALSAAGLDTSKMKSFAATFVAFIREKAGDEVADEML